MKKIANNQGFTLVELLIICPILMVVIAILMNFIFNQYGQLLVQNTAIDLQVQSSQIISAIKDDVEKSPALVSQLDTELIDNNAPDGGWKADNNSVLMMSIPAYTNKSDVSGVQKVLINSRGCSPEQVRDQNDQLNYNVVFFARGAKLYKRLITNSNASTCGTNYLKQSCPTDLSSVDCPEDRLLTDQLASFNIKYIDANNQPVDRPESATMIAVDVKLKNKAYAEDVIAGSNLKIRKLST